MTDFSKTVYMQDFGSVPLYTKMPCGAVGQVDTQASYPAYRCTHCFAICGSMGMPAECYELYEQQYNEKHGG